MDITYSFMIPILEAIAKATHSYGLAIVLLTVLVRILVHPLVASSTRSMQRMSQMQPQIKAIQERYKGDPEQFQKKAMEFYQKNKINPMGGCLPTLVQLPVLFALFATFTGPPFGDKPVPVKIKVVAQSEAASVTRQEVSGANSPYVTKDGDLAKVVVYPGDSTVLAGQEIDFGVRAVEGKLPSDFNPGWKITCKPGAATIKADGQVNFKEPGEATVEAVIPGVAKNEPFLFINSLGKVVQGMDILKPENWDNLGLILLFGVTMWISQKIMVQPPAANADPEQLMIQQQTQRTMPIAVTAMFFFIPLPSGVFLYMVVSNVIQTLQTWFIMRTPAPALVDVLAEGGAKVPDKPARQESASTAEQSGSNNGNAPQKKSPGKKKTKKKK